MNRRSFLKRIAGFTVAAATGIALLPKKEEKFVAARNHVLSNQPKKRLRLSCGQGGAVVRYTTDGSVPNEFSNHFYEIEHAFRPLNPNAQAAIQLIASPESRLPL
jgi:anaerobic selenocysteine-containing dehydrogenase